MRYNLTLSFLFGHALLFIYGCWIGWFKLIKSLKWHTNTISLLLMKQFTFPKLVLNMIPSTEIVVHARAKPLSLSLTCSFNHILNRCVMCVWQTVEWFCMVEITTLNKWRWSQLNWYVLNCVWFSACKCVYTHIYTHTTCALYVFRLNVDMVVIRVWCPPLNGKDTLTQ